MTLEVSWELETYEDFWSQGWQDPRQGPVLIDTRLAKHKVLEKKITFLQIVSFSVENDPLSLTNIKICSIKFNLKRYFFYVHIQFGSEVTVF